VVKNGRGLIYSSILEFVWW